MFIVKEVSSKKLNYTYLKTNSVGKFLLNEHDASGKFRVLHKKDKAE
jgi:hypothetical protein